MSGLLPAAEGKPSSSTRSAATIKAEALVHLKWMEEQWQWYIAPGRMDASPQGMTLEEAIQSGREHLVDSRPDLAVACYDLAMHLSAREPLSLRLELCLALALLGLHDSLTTNLMIGFLENNLNDPSTLPPMDKALAAAFEMMMIDNDYFCTLQCGRGIGDAKQLSVRMDDFLEELQAGEDEESEDSAFSMLLAVTCYLRSSWSFQVNLREQHLGPGDAKAFDEEMGQRVRALEGVIRRRKWTIGTALLSVIVRELPFHDSVKVTQRNHLVDAEETNALKDPRSLQSGSLPLPSPDAPFEATRDAIAPSNPVSTFDLVPQRKAFDDPNPYQLRDFSAQLATTTETRWYVKLAFIMRHLVITTIRRLPAYMHRMIQSVFDLEDPHLNDVVDSLRRVDRTILQHMGRPRMLKETLDARELRISLRARKETGLNGKVISEGTILYSNLADRDCNILKATVSLSIARALVNNPANLTDDWHVHYAIEWVDTAERLIPDSLPGLRDEGVCLRMEVYLVHRPHTEDVKPFVEATLAAIQSDCLNPDPDVVDRAMRRAIHLINLCVPLSDVEEFPDRRKLWIWKAFRIIQSKQEAMRDDVRPMYQALRQRFEEPDVAVHDNIRFLQPKSAEECDRLVARLEGDLKGELSRQAQSNDSDDLAIQDRIQTLRREMITWLMEQQRLLFGEERTTVLRKVLDQYDALDQEVRPFGNFEDMVSLTTGRMLAEWTAFKLQTPAVDADRVLATCCILEEYLDGTRRNSQVSSGVNEDTTSGASNLLAQQVATGQPRGKILSTVYFDVALRTNQLALAWEWQQKVKARSVTERILSGSVFEIPETFRKRLDKDPVAANLLIDEERLGKVAQRTMGVRPRLAALSELREHRTCMRRESALLAELLDLRDGRPRGLLSLRADFEGDNEIRQYLTPPATVIDSAPNIWLIDWLMWPYMRPTVILLVILPLTGTLPIRKSCVWGPYEPESPDSLEGWVERCWEDNKHKDTLGGQDEGHLRFKDLDKLVEPIGRLANPDDTLVLSPTGLLNSLPLHALTVNGRPLISRHKIVYAANATVFSRCVKRSLERNSQSTPAATGRISVASVYEPDPQPPTYSRRFEIWKRNQQGFPEIQGEIQSRTEQVAQVLSAEYLWSKAVTRESFMDLLKTSNLAVYYGHCDQSPDGDILKQSLRLFDGPFQVIDVLKTPLPNSTLILIACGSSAQHIRAADEPLGLVTAGLIAGAASIVGTLWPVLYESAMYFLTNFVEHLKRQASDPAVRALARRGPRRGKVMLSLATALQFATLEVKKRYVVPYHWAPYVLHGSPIAESPF